jgi:hypothetical protein
VSPRCDRYRSAIPDARATARFEAAMAAAFVHPPDSGTAGTAAALFADAKLFGERYFFIPDLGRHRGTSHVFVFSLSAGDVAGLSHAQCAAFTG